MPVDIVWESGLSASVLAATFAFSLFGTFAFALGPALKLSKAAVIEDLKEHPGEDAGQRRWKFLPRNPLVVVQIAFSLALLTAAALFIRGAGKAAAVDTGLQAGNDFLLEVDASLAGYDQARAQDLYRTLEERLAALPGVEHASISSTVPFGMVSLSKSVQIGGVNPAPDSKPATAADGLAFGANFNSVGADYFSTVGMKLLRGRVFNTAEAMHESSVKVAIIDQVLAKKLWPDGDALGQHIQFAGDSAPRAKGSGSTGVGVQQREVEIRMRALRLRSSESLRIPATVSSKRTRGARFICRLPVVFKAMFSSTSGLPRTPTAIPRRRLIWCVAPCAKWMPRCPCSP